MIWLAGIFCLLLIEPIAYFPQWFGLEEAMGLTFVHNQFSVQFLYDRLPLYIVAMYPFFGYARMGIGAAHGYLPTVPPGGGSVLCDGGLLLAL